MYQISMLIKRNIKMFFKDKGLFFLSLITPLILLVLYVTFLGKIYTDSMRNAFPVGFNIDDNIINSIVGGQLLSCLLATSCITIAFCCNSIIVNDKANGAYKDIFITSIKKYQVAIAYFLSTLIVTLILAYITLAGGLIYIALNEWVYTFNDIILIVMNVFIVSLFGTILSCFISSLIKTPSQMQAISTVVSSTYGFITGAYMPLASFSNGLRNTLSVLPTTHITCIIKNACMNGPLRKLSSLNVPDNIIDEVKLSIDVSLKVGDTKITYIVLWLSVITTMAVLLGCFIITLKYRKKK